MSAREEIEQLEIRIGILEERVRELEDDLDRDRIRRTINAASAGDICARCGELVERSGAAWMSAVRMVEKCPGHMVPIAGGAS
ncbi:hypothetical protein [Microbacterium hydrocarbonoxydans]|uniref:hypothetical protein n=1 Tax=Microbacterium hydrocarbonoxydans TaxID=273678 RepID=UPI003D95308B